MTIYILKAYPNAHKWEPDSWVIGYFTNKSKLQKAIAMHWRELGGYQKKDFCREFFNAYYRGDWRSCPNNYLESGEIQTVTANEF